jgi:hypothetical protein
MNLLRQNTQLPGIETGWSLLVDERPESHTKPSSISYPFGLVVKILFPFEFKISAQV